jgi:AcrR family transcriptional regulator
MTNSKKTSRKAIVDAAVKVVEQDGAEALSMRAVAKQLGLMPNALRNYVPNRTMLEAMAAAEAMERLRAALKRAAKGSADAEAASRACHAYLRFAGSHPALYAVMMRKYPDTPRLLAARMALRDFPRAFFASIEDPRLAATAVLAWWAFLHGMAELGRHGLLESSDPPSGSFSEAWDLIEGMSRSLTR